MNKFKVIRKLKKVKFNECLIIHVKDFDTYNLEQVRILGETLTNDYPEVKHLFVTKSDMMECEIKDIDDTINFLKHKIKELEITKETLELKEELEKLGITF